MAMAITVVVCGMAIFFFFQGLRSSLKTTAVFTNDMSQWSLTNRLLIDSKLANAVSVYADNTKTTLTTAKSNGHGIAEGNFGKFIVLSKGTQPTGSTTVQYSTLFGYAYDSTTQKLSRFEYQVPTAEAGNALEATLLTHMSDFVYRPVATNLTLQNTAGPFLLRKNGVQANMVILASAGSTKLTSALTRSDRMIEVSFFTRQ
jgi:hypothetical protein